MTQLQQALEAALALGRGFVPEQCQVTEKALAQLQGRQPVDRGRLSELQGGDLGVQGFEALKRGHGVAPWVKGANHVEAMREEGGSRLLPATGPQTAQAQRCRNAQA
ncbi:hypothetical protein D9M71_213760 [compost metagenome]